MKILLLLLVLRVPLDCLSQENEPEFGLYFGNDFKNDSVTIFVNGTLIARNIKLKPTMIDPKNLVIVQDRSGVTIRPYYHEKQTLKRILIKKSILNLNIGMNGLWKSFQFDLRKGKYLYAEYVYFRLGWSFIKILRITQEKYGPIYI